MPSLGGPALSLLALALCAVAPLILARAGAVRRPCWAAAENPMALYDSDHPDVPNMKGLHLFHFAMSNCSQRVRLGLGLRLEEKGLAWTSHHLNLPANEHVTADYQRINPNGVLPTLVHDGQVILESNDILGYLDEKVPEPPLRPADAAAREPMGELIALAGGFQPTIKALSHELLFRPFRKVDDTTVALFEQEHRDPSLVAFLISRKTAGRGRSASSARVRTSKPL